MEFENISGRADGRQEPAPAASKQAIPRMYPALRASEGEPEPASAPNRTRRACQASAALCGHCPGGEIVTVGGDGFHLYDIARLKVLSFDADHRVNFRGVGMTAGSDKLTLKLILSRDLH